MIFANVCCIVHVLFFLCDGAVFMLSENIPVFMHWLLIRVIGFVIPGDMNIFQQRICNFLFILYPIYL